MAIITRTQEKKSREDGWLVELFSGPDFRDFKCEHSYMVSIAPGNTRARHYHESKTEIIAPVSGRTTIIIEDIKTKTRQTLEVDAEAEKVDLVLIPPRMAHAISNKTKKDARIVVFTDATDLSDVVRYEFVGW